MTSDLFKSEITGLVNAAIQNMLNAAGISAELPDLAALLTVPPSFDLGQAAMPCFAFSKMLRQPPLKIAEQLATAIAGAEKKYVSKVSAVAGYLNFECAFPEFGAAVLPRIISGKYFEDARNQQSKEKIVVEYSQPNTHKSLHVGHLRCLVLGDAVCNLLAYSGEQVVRVTYPGDKGANTAKTLWYMKYRNKDPIPENNRALWLGDIYARADTGLEAEVGTPQEATNRAQLREIMKNVEDEKSEDYALWKKTRDWCFDEMHRIYNWLRVRFDIWFTESECDVPARELVLQKKKEGAFVESEGAIGIDLSAYKLGFAMYLKSDGHTLYLTKDLELMRRKFSDPAVTRSIYVVDSRQKLHFAQLFKTGELLGYPQASRSVHLPYETVNTEDGKAFSSRALNGLKLSDLRTEMENRVTTEYLERYRGQWTDDEIKETAEIVTIGALKYGMLRVDNNTQITFSLAEWLRLDGDTGPYLQYVHARCKNILEKQGQPKPVEKFVTELPVENELVFWLARFNEFALHAAATYRPSVVAGYLFDLARLFNRFYEACPIRSSTGELRESRLTLVDATAHSIATGLGLLGIPAPRRM